MIIKEEIVLPQAANPARDQGQRPTCIAFALSELNLRCAPKIQALSAEYVYQAAANMTPGWVPGTGVRLGVALQAASSGQPVETDFPYQSNEPAAPVPAPPKKFDLYGSKLRMLPRDLESIAKAIRCQRPVGIGIKLTRSFYDPTNGVIAFESEPVPNALHAVIVVGLGQNEGIPYFRIRNSWGDGWGLQGQAWLSGDYLREHAICAFGV